MGDIWRAGLPPAERSRTAWLPALWWVSWLLAAPPVHVRSGKTSAAWIIPPDGWLSFALYAIAGLTLIEIVRRVSTGPVGWPDVGPDDPMAGGGQHLAATSI